MNVLLVSAGQQAAAIRSGTLRPSELLEAALERIEELNGKLNAVVTLDVEGARSAARTADTDAAAGRWRGPLHGLPITVKDALETAGLRSTGGARELAHHIPARDAPAVERLRRAGAVVMGKTNVPRWSGDGQTYNDIFGTTNNPWSQDLTPGGSSGGAAAAVATGCSSFEIGTDIGGSIRIPSSFVGVCGHKPSYGIVPQGGYLDHVGGGLIDADVNVVGPIARSVDDLSLVLDVIAGPAPVDEKAWRLNLPASRRPDAQGCRVGVWAEDPAVPVSKEITAAVLRAADLLAGAGAHILSDRPPISMDEGVGYFNETVLPAVSVSIDDRRAASMDTPPGGSHRDWLKMQERRTDLFAAWRQYFENHDVLLCPVTPTAAFAHQQAGDLLSRTIDVDGVDRPMMSLFSWTGMIGAAKLPATVVPVASTAERHGAVSPGAERHGARAGLPIGVQVVGPYLEDRTTLAVARHLLALAGGWTPPPLVSAARG